MSDSPSDPKQNAEKSGAEAPAETDAFALQLASTLSETERELSSLSDPSSAMNAASWQKARKVVEQFQPVPWFIWRLCNYVLGQSGKINTRLPEGFVLGLRKLLCAAASDRVLGKGEKVENLKTALSVVSSDAIAAVSVIHAVSRRLSSFQFERMWRPMLDDAILRCHIGCFVGERNPSFGAGRGMLAGFAGRSGLAILISTGELEQARRALELLATGTQISQVGLKVYECDPLQVSALLLSACGCGRDAAFGTVSFGSPEGAKLVRNEEQKRWLAAYTITESIRTGTLETVPAEYWTVMSFESEQEREDLGKDVKKMVRRGHGWNWLI
jgi:predicted house-cleaning NTP pyrophosphatase (Maf/HAM1 superfamily)